MTLGVERDGKTLDVTVTPTDEAETRELDIVEHVGRIGIAPRFPAAVIGVAHARLAGRAGKLQTFDQITAVNGRRVERFIELVDALAENRGDQVVVSYLRPVTCRRRWAASASSRCSSRASRSSRPRRAPPGATPPADAQARAADVLARTGIESADLYVAFVPEASSEWRAGLRPGDRITTLDGTPQRLWSTMEDELVAGADRRHELTWTRDGVPMRGFFQLRKEQWDDEFGQHFERYVFRTDALAAQRARPPRAQPASARVRAPARRRGDAQRHQVHQHRRAAPRAGAAVAVDRERADHALRHRRARRARRGRTYFVRAMALISVNLGLINLLPIPVLDGGHLLFFLFEAARRRPLPLRIREVASLAGMVVLMLLTMVAFKNDVERRWDVIVTQVRELMS